MKLYLAITSIVLSLALQMKAGSPPVITAQPQSQTARAGTNITFLVSASLAGDPVLPTVTSATLKVWLKADLGVIAVGGKVTQWKDQSGNTNHVSQVDSNLQPSLVAGAVPNSGRPGVRFDGIISPATGDFLQGTGNVGIPSDYTSFLVYSKANRVVGEEVPLLVGVPGSSGAVRAHYIRNGSVSNEMAFSGWGLDLGTGFSIPPNTWRIWTHRLIGNQVGFFDTDGTSSMTQTQSINGLSSPSVGLFVGGLGAESRNFQGDIAEVLIYQGALSETDRVAVETYLKQRYFQLSEPGAGTLTYQWSFNGNTISNATSSSLILSNVSTNNAGQFRVAVSNNFGATLSSNAVLTVFNPVVITAHPQSAGVLVGSNVTFNVAATGSEPLSFQWLFKGTNISGATGASFSITNVQETNAGLYSVLVTNAVSAVQSSNAFLSVLSPPQIITQPRGATVLAGTNVVLNVSVLGGGSSSLPTVSSGTLELWLRADAGISMDGSNRVNQWQDQSSRTNHCVQGNVNLQPVWVASGMNNRPVLRFDGIQDGVNGDFLQGSGAVQIPNGFTSFFVYSHANRIVTEEVPVAIGVPGSAGRMRSYYLRSAGSVVEMAFSAWGFDFGTGFNIAPSIPRLWTDRVNAAKTQLEFFDYDGTNAFSVTKAISGFTTISPGYFIGGLGGNVRNFQGDIAEVLYYQGTLSDVDRLAVEDHLKSKYLQAGGGSVAYQWLFNGTNVVGATNASLLLTNAQPISSGNYTVVITNSAGSVTSAPAVVNIRFLFAAANGQRLTNAQTSFVTSAQISFQSYFTNGSIFYTLDGSTPSFSSRAYTGPFTLSRDAVIRAIVFSPDFSQSGQSDPVTVNIIPTFTLAKVTAGGGTIANTGTSPFLSNTVITVTATPLSGWTFLQWLGDASGTNPMTSVNMTRNKSVRAVFGTTLSTTTSGNGAVFLNPSAGLYPFGSTVRLTALPETGNFFGVWGNAASGNTNPLDFVVINANQTVSSLFSALSGGQFALTLSSSGFGRATASPRANAYSSGQTVTLTATPDAGQTFLGWTGGGTSGTNNPLAVTMSQNRNVTANFSKSPLLTVQFDPSTVGFEGFQLTLNGAFGESYSLQRSSNLVDWATFLTVTNSYGTSQTSDLPSTNSTGQFYRATQP